MATHLANIYPNIEVTMMNYGGPRVGNWEFKGWSEQLSNLALWRYVYDYDIVTRIPLNTMGFYHAGHTFQLWPGDYSSIYYRHEGNGGDYEGAPWYWYCKYRDNICKILGFFIV